MKIKENMIFNTSWLSLPFEKRRPAYRRADVTCYIGVVLPSHRVAPLLYNYNYGPFHLDNQSVCFKSHIWHYF